MPIYEYECLTCGITFEKRQSFSDEPKADCPNGHKETRRLIAAPAIVFKGSGFYVTDNKSRNGAGISGKNDKSDKSDKAESKETTETKSEATTASNKETT